MHKKQEVAGASELSEPRGCAPSCQPSFAADLLRMASGVEVEAVTIVQSVPISGGELCFFSLTAGEGLKVGRGGQGGMWHVACGMWDGARFLFSLLFTLSGRVVGISLPDLGSMRHYICRACFLLGATPTVWCIRGGCTGNRFGNRGSRWV